MEAGRVLRAYFFPRFSHARLSSECLATRCGSRLLAWHSFRRNVIVGGLVEDYFRQLSEISFLIQKIGERLGSGSEDS
jgi:hypothetical protein